MLCDSVFSQPTPSKQMLLTEAPLDPSEVLAIEAPPANDMFVVKKRGPMLRRHTGYIDITECDRKNPHLRKGPDY